MKKLPVLKIEMKRIHFRELIKDGKLRKFYHVRLLTNFKIEGAISATW